MISAFPVPLISLVYPMLTVAAFWALAVWALKTSGPITPAVRALTDPQRQGPRGPRDSEELGERGRAP